MTPLQTIAVVGAGVIGRGVAQDCAEHELDVILVDRDEAILDAALEEIRQQARLYAMLRKRTHDPARVLSRIRATTSIDAIGAADVVVENVTEQTEIKEAVWDALARFARADALLAANTSCIPIASFAARVARPERVVGLHFMNPVALTTMVEVVRGAATHDATLADALAFVGRLGKTGIVVADRPGFAINRVLMPTLNEAMWVVHDQVASAADVDRLFTGCLGHKMGPLATADLIGLDTVLRSLDVLHAASGDPKFAPCPLLVKLVSEGRLGRKSGRGFFDHGSEEAP